MCNHYINYESVNKKKKKNHDEIMVMRKAKLNTIERPISMVFIDSYISHDEFFSLNNVLREYNQMK